jgi:hypothetical protein
VEVAQRHICNESHPGRVDRLLIKTSGREGRTSTGAWTCHFQDTARRASRIYPESHVTVEVQPLSRPRASHHPLQIYHAAGPETGQRLAEQLIDTLHTCPIPELARLGRTLRQWRHQILAYFATDGGQQRRHRGDL